jgi:hypothetical protein
MITVLLDERGKRLGPDHRHVTRKYEHRGIAVFKKFTRGIHRIAGAELCGLPDKNGLVFLKLLQDGGLYLFALVADHYIDLLGRQGGCGPANVVDKRAPVKAVEDLCQIRTHPCAQPRGQYQNVEIQLFVGP